MERVSRWQRGDADGRVAACLILAGLAHVAGIGGALLVASRPPTKVSDALSFIDAIVETPAFANPVEAAEPARPPAPVVEAPAPPRQAPPLTNSLHGASAGDLYEPAAAVAAASKVITGNDDSAYDVATRDDNRELSYGKVAGEGTVDVVTSDSGAILGGIVGGTGAGAFKKGRGGDDSDDKGPDRSRRSSVLGGYTDECEFPDAARGIDSAIVVVVVTVRPNGTASSVVVASDPGHGFAAAAHACAMRSKYIPALDRQGHKVASITTPINVRFTR
jgi:protein TonB